MNNRKWKVKERVSDPLGPSRPDNPAASLVANAVAPAKGLLQDDLVKLQAKVPLLTGKALVEVKRAIRFDEAKLNKLGVPDRPVDVPPRVSAVPSAPQRIW
jgi:hypothetical protein